jgi:hypothetical protein
MSTRASSRQTKTKKSKYLLFAVLGLLSFFAYTNSYNATKSIDADKIAALKAKNKSKSQQTQELHTPFVERWEKTYTDIDEYLADSGFRKTPFFLEGQMVASNDINNLFELPTEETGAGIERYIRDLDDAAAASIVPASVSAPSGGGSGGSFAAGGGGGGGNGGGRNNPSYLATPSDLDPNNSDDSNNTNIPGNDGNLSAVPVPPAIWLLGSALLGFVGLRRK